MHQLTIVFACLVALLTDLLISLAERRPALRTSVVAVFIANEENSTFVGIGVDQLAKDGYLDQLKGGPLFWIDAADSQPCIGKRHIHAYMRYVSIDSKVYPLGTAGATQWQLKVKGKVFHSGLPHKGINSIEMAMDAVSYIQKKFFAAFPRHPMEVRHHAICYAIRLGYASLTIAVGQVQLLHTVHAQAHPNILRAGGIEPAAPGLHCPGMLSCPVAAIVVVTMYVCEGGHPPGAILRHRRGAAGGGGLRRGDQRRPGHHREPGHPRPALQVPAAGRRRQGIHRAQVGGGGSYRRIHVCMHVCMGVQLINAMCRARLGVQGENGVACKLDSRGYGALIRATRSVLGDAKPYAIGGSLPLIRSLQEQGFDVQISGYGASAK